MKTRSILSCSLALFLGCVSGDDTGAPDSGGKDSTANDAPTSSDAPVGDAAPDAPFTPAVIDQAGQLALWLEASPANLTISSGQVGQWNDLSKNHNNATNSNGGPVVDDAAVNGKNAVFFGPGGTTLQIAANATIDLGTDQFLIMAVSKSTGTASTYFFSKVTTKCLSGCQFYTGLEFYSERGTSSDGGPQTFTSFHWAMDTTDAGTIVGDTTSWDGSVFDDAKFHVVGLRRTAIDTIALFVDGQTQTTSGLHGDNVNVNTAALLGAIHYGNTAPQDANGDIAEIVVVHGGIIADQTVTNLYAYFKSKYAL